MPHHCRLVELDALGQEAWENMAGEPRGQNMGLGPVSSTSFLWLSHSLSLYFLICKMRH